MEEIEQKKILIVDDAPEARLLLRNYCVSEGFEVSEASSASTFEAAFKKLDTFDAVVLDIVLPDIDGFEMLARIQNQKPRLPVIMSTALDDAESVIRCLRLGAKDYITKPFDKIRFTTSLRNVIEAKKLTTRVRQLSRTLSEMVGVQSIVGRSKNFVQVLKLAQRAKDSKATVLLLGESGVGKEVIARALHFQGKRSSEPFITLNCGALPPSLLESELFGYEKGAFTGADQTRPGKFEGAQKGTIFLDEIGEMSLESQVRLLRVLQERTITRLGSNQEIPVEARVICATHQDLEENIQKGLFREDLYYRISSYPIEIPPLRERLEDILVLAEHFLQRIMKREKKKLEGFETDAIQAMENYSWPGNIRELENVVERAVLLTDGRRIPLHVLPKHIQVCLNRLSAGDPSFQNKRKSVSLGDSTERSENASLSFGQLSSSSRSSFGRNTMLQKESTEIAFDSPDTIIPFHQIEEEVILAALKACQGDIQETARRLEISRATIYRRLRQYGIQPDVHRSTPS